MPDKKEAASLVTAAEKHLKVGSAQQSVQAATAASEIFRELGKDGEGALPDVLRLVIDGKRMLAIQQQEDLAPVRQFADDAKSNFAKAGNTRGEAAMMISMAEITLSERTRPLSKAPLPSIQLVDQALQKAKDAGDQKLTALALLVMSETYLERPAVVEAQSAADAAMKVFEEHGDKLNKARALRASGRCLLAGGKTSAGKQQVQAAIEIFREEGARRLEAEEFLALSEYLLLSGKAKSALAAAEQGLTLLKVLNNSSKVEEMAALLKVSDCLMAVGKGKTAVMRGQEAAQQCSETGDVWAGVMALQIVAAAQLQLGKRRESLRTAKAAKEALGAKRNDSLLARALRDEGAALAVLEDYDEAITRLKDAASTAVSADDLATQASIKRFEADVHINRSNFKEALSAARDALEISERQGDKRNMARALETVSTAQGVLNNFQQAVKEAKECQDLYQEVGDPMGEERALELLAKLRAAEGNLEGALEAGLERLAVVRESGSPEKEADALHQEAALHFQSGNLAMAEKSVQEAKSVAKKAGTAGTLSEILVTLGHIYLEKSDMTSEASSRYYLELAARACADAVAAAGKARMKRTWGQALLFRGRAMLRLGRRMEAWRSAVDSSNKCQEAGDGPGMCRALLLAGEIQIENNDLAMAQDILVQAQDVAELCNEEELGKRATALLERTKVKAPVAAAIQIEDVAEDAPAAATEAAQAASSAAPAAPKGLDPVLVRKAVMRLVKDAIADDGELEVDSPFMEAGMDSLSSVALTSSLAKEFGFALSPSLVFDFPNVRALEAHLVEESLSR